MDYLDKNRTWTIVWIVSFTLFFVSMNYSAIWTIIALTFFIGTSLWPSFQEESPKYKWTLVDDEDEVFDVREQERKPPLSNFQHARGQRWEKR